MPADAEATAADVDGAVGGCDDADGAAGCDGNGFECG